MRFPQPISHSLNFKKALLGGTAAAGLAAGAMGLWGGRGQQVPAPQPEPDQVQNVSSTNVQAAKKYLQPSGETNVQAAKKYLRPAEPAQPGEQPAPGAEPDRAARRAAMVQAAKDMFKDGKRPVSGVYYGDGNGYNSEIGRFHTETLPDGTQVYVTEKGKFVQQKDSLGKMKLVPLR